MDFLLLYHFRKLKGVAIEILQVLIDDITTNMIFEIMAIKFLSEIEKYLVMANLGLILTQFEPKMGQNRPYSFSQFSHPFFAKYFSQNNLLHFAKFREMYHSNDVRKLKVFVPP